MSNEALKAIDIRQRSLEEKLTAVYIDMSPVEARCIFLEWFNLECKSRETQFEMSARKKNGGRDE